MKKIILSLLISMISLPTLAFDDYVIISARPIRYVNVQNDEILTIRPVSTIDNDKKLLIMTPKKEGKTKINVFSGEEVRTIEVNVTEKSTEIQPTDGFEYYIIDEPTSGGANG